MDTVYQNGALIPNSTQVPDLILDRWMAELSGAEFKIVMYVARRTYGFRRASDDISLAQMASGIVTKDGRRFDGGTGLNKDTVTKAVAALIDKGVLLRTRHADDRGRDLPSTYSINLSCEFGRGEEKTVTGVGKSDPTPPAPEKPDPYGSENPTPPAEKSDSPVSENPTHRESENPTHNKQSDTYMDKQSDKQRVPVPDAVPAPKPAVVVSDKNMDGFGEGENGSLILRLESIGLDADAAACLIRDFSAEIVDQVISSARTRQLTRGAAHPTAYMRKVCRRSATESAEAQAKAERERTTLRAPRPAAASAAKADAHASPPEKAARSESFDHAAAYAALDEADRTVLDEAAWARAMADAPAPIRARIEAASKSQEPPSHMVRDLLLIARNRLLAERAAAEAKRERQIDLDFN